jgi:hypothetical protein
MANHTLVEVVEVNAWTLRCMFNQSRIPDRIASGELSIEKSPKAKLSKKPNHPKDSKSQHIWIRDQSGVEVASAHYYVCPTGPVTPLDPKTIKIGSIRYVIHPDTIKANPEHRLPFIWMRKVYGWIRRKVICPVWGPLDVLPYINIVDYSL